MRCFRLRALLPVAVLFGTVGPAAAALLGMHPGYPLVGYDSGGTTHYTAENGRFTLTATTASVRTGASSPVALVRPASVTGQRLLRIECFVDASGRVTGGVPGDDLVVTGKVTLDGTVYDGVLLTGEIIGFGHSDSGNNVDDFDFRFRLTGGQMAPLYGELDLGVVTTSENSSFQGNFTSDFAGGAKGNLGASPTACTYTVGDFVWWDEDRNGVQDDGEAGIGGVRIELVDAETGETIRSTETAGDGGYLFAELCPHAPYLVRVVAETLPPDFSPTTPRSPDGEDGRGEDSNEPDGTYVTPVPAVDDADRNLTVDFGYVACAGTLGDLVWEDLNRNGTQEAGEPGLAGATVELTDANGSPAAPPVVTSPTGAYAFSGLCEGTYTVEVTPPAGYTATPSLQGIDAAADSNGSPWTVTLPSESATDTTIDFGFFQVAGPGCSLTIGYWKTHAGFGPQADAVSPLLPVWLGTAGGPESVQVGDARTARDILAMTAEYGSRSNGITKLYAQLLGAKLNAGVGADGAAVAAVVSAADAFLATHAPSAWTGLRPAERKTVLAWASALDDYNNGKTGPGHCSD